jgi:hypothetical protein
VESVCGLSASYRRTGAKNRFGVRISAAVICRHQFNQQILMNSSKVRFPLPLRAGLCTHLTQGVDIIVLNYIVFYFPMDSGFRRNDSVSYFSVIPAKAGIQ